MGALDGTHISVHVPAGQSILYQNRKGDLTQNVLAACDFDMKFTYVLPRWEGSAHDARVLGDAVSNKDFTVPKQQYYLADAGYTNADWLLTPYRGVRYHLKEFRLGNSGPENAKKLFNLQHASLRNVVERIFGVLKKRFKCIRTIPEYSLHNQALIVYAITRIHNVIRVYRKKAEENDMWEVTDAQEQAITSESASDDVDATSRLPEKQYYITSQMMNIKRDEIADEMWTQYQEYMETNYVE